MGMTMMNAQLPVLAGCVACYGGLLSTRRKTIQRRIINGQIAWHPGLAGERHTLSRFSSMPQPKQQEHRSNREAPI
jgi:hypothetical protein